MADELVSGTERAIWLRKRLRARRKELRKTQAELAELVRAELGWDTLSKQAISQWENFQTQPTIDALAAWCRVLGLRLRVTIVEPHDDRVLTPLRRDSVEIVERFEALNEEQRAAVAATVRAFSGK